VCIVVDPTGPLTGSARGMGEAASLVGTCLDTNGEPVDCATAHDSELYAVVELPDGPWPGQKALDAASEQPCVDHFAGYVGVAYDQSTLDSAPLPPDEESWGAGDRQVWCLVVDPAGPLTGVFAAVDDDDDSRAAPDPLAWRVRGWSKQASGARQGGADRMWNRGWARWLG
jgi:Septum formation